MRVQNLSLPTNMTTSSLGWTKICRSTSVFYSDIYVVVKFAVRHICSIGIFVIILWWAKTRRNIQYSQKWANDQLQIVTTCLQRHNFWSPNFNFYNITCKEISEQAPLVNNCQKFGVPRVALYTNLSIRGFVRKEIRFKINCCFADV